MKTVYRKKERINKELAIQLCKQVKLSPVITEFLCDKGYKDKTSIDRFINFTDKNLRRVSQMKDGMEFISRLAIAVKEKQNIVVFGDYDGDGICATSIFIWTLRWLGIEANYFISNRFKEGYGLSIKAMDRMLTMYPNTDLIVTCDNGIVAFEAVDYAKSKDVDVIISDHHISSPDGKLPNCPVVCEKRLDENQEIIEEFCGAELARRLCFGLVCYLNRYHELKDKLSTLYAFSGFATITDVIAFNAANHYVAKRGLEEINKNVFHCFDALKRVKELTREVDEVTIGYHLGPMINAAGRITGEATIPVELFISEDFYDAMDRATELLELNAVRQSKSLELQKLAKREYKFKCMNRKKFIILSGIGDECYDEGIAGLIASFIVDNYKKPCICLAKTEQEGIYKGSARSVEGFNIKAVLDASKELLLRYGGHTMAAGLSLRIENLEALDAKLNELADDTKSLIEYVDIDYFEKPYNFSFDLIKEYEEYLAPFGPGFEKPVFATSGIFDENIRVMKEKHIKTILHNENTDVELLWFNSITKFEKQKPSNKAVMVIGQPSINDFNGNVQIIADRVVALDK